jgi:ribonuclease Z
MHVIISTAKKQLFTGSSKASPRVLKSARTPFPPGVSKALVAINKAKGVADAKVGRSAARQNIKRATNLRDWAQSRKFPQTLVPFDRVVKDEWTNSWIVYEPFITHTQKSKETLFETKLSDSERDPKERGFDKMRNFLEIITAPTADTPGTTVLLHFDKHRYFFGNVSEGTQRACVQRKMSLLKVEDIFLTGKIDWATSGGLVGMILTIADAQASSQQQAIANPKQKGSKTSEQRKKMRIHGAQNLMHTIATTRRFVFRQGMPLEVDEVEDNSHHDLETPIFKDGNIMVWAMDIQEGQSHLRSSRKRSHEDISDDNIPTLQAQSLDGPINETEQERTDRYSQIRKGVVTHMFDSDWKLDALHPMKLADVPMPAAIFIRGQDGKIEKYSGILPGGDESVPDLEVLVRKPWPAAKIDTLPPTAKSSSALSYIVKNHPQRGKFNKEEALRLGVKQGPQFSQLSKGQSVTTADGKLVTPEMVLEPTKTGNGFAIVELPSTSYVEQLVSRKEWASPTIMDGVRAIIWILGKGVLADKRLKKFREQYRNLDHIISSVDCCTNNIALDSAAKAAVKLHLVDPARFPIPAHTNHVANEVGISSTSRAARAGTVITLEPEYEVSAKGVEPFFSADKVIEETPEDVLALAKIALQKIADPAYLAHLEKLQEDIPSKDAEVIALGTGSALPSKYRNVSATLVRVPGYGNYLFDCGENTLGQLKRVFGSELPQILRDLKVIWISHLHADHHLGTASVLSAWNAETHHNNHTKSQNIIVASESGMLKWLSEYSGVEDFGYNRVVPVLMHAADSYKKDFTESETALYGLQSIVACPVSHCNGALAVAFTFPNGFKIAYSGDCRPSNRFAEIGQNATLLIHEATFDDELIGDAKAKKHCTTGEALMIGKKMKARRILLTHFSQRYQKIPVMDSEGADQVAIVAFDYMKCKIGDFAKVAEFIPALLKLYEEKEET